MIPPIHLTIDAHSSQSELCQLGAKWRTDKSPLNLGYSQENEAFRHSYTPIYSTLLSPFRDKEMNFVELGIFLGFSMQFWREYFSKAHLYCYDFAWNFIELGNNLRLPNTEVGLMDVNNPETITAALARIPGGLDILIDDSTHVFEHQINIVRATLPFLKSGGIIIIEDVFRKIPEQQYCEFLKDVAEEFSFWGFFDTDHDNKCIGEWDNDKLLYIVKR